MLREVETLPSNHSKFPKWKPTALSAPPKEPDQITPTVSFSRSFQAARIGSLALKLATNPERMLRRGEFGARDGKKGQT